MKSLDIWLYICEVLKYIISSITAIKNKKNAVQATRVKNARNKYKPLFAKSLIVTLM